MRVILKGRERIRKVEVLRTRYRLFEILERREKVRVERGKDVKQIYY